MLTSLEGADGNSVSAREALGLYKPVRRWCACLRVRLCARARSPAAAEGSFFMGYILHCTVVVRYVSLLVRTFRVLGVLAQWILRQNEMGMRYERGVLQPVSAGFSHRAWCMDHMPAALLKDCLNALKVP